MVDEKRKHLVVLTCLVSKGRQWPDSWCALSHFTRLWCSCVPCFQAHHPCLPNFICDVCGDDSSVPHTAADYTAQQHQCAWQSRCQHVIVAI